MTEFKCDECNRTFDLQESLDQHNQAKHVIGGIKSKHELKKIKKHEKETHQYLENKNSNRSKMLKNIAYAAVILVIISSAFVLLSSQKNDNSTVSLADVPEGPIHWHPKLTIVLNGQQQIIPSELGAIGSHQPVHTHDATGVLHYENNNPTPENMPLSYFFEKIWRKQFNNNCIFNYCNADSKTVKFFVNGKENSEFENYIPKDGDDIRIEY